MKLTVNILSGQSYYGWQRYSHHPGQPIQEMPSAEKLAVRIPRSATPTPLPIRTTYACTYICA